MKYTEIEDPATKRITKSGWCWRGNDWLQDADTAPRIFQQFHAKQDSLIGGKVILRNLATDEPLYAHPTSLAAELGCKSIRDLQ